MSIGSVIESNLGFESNKNFSSFNQLNVDDLGKILIDKK